MTPIKVIDTIVSLNSKNDMIGLIKYHDKMLTMNVGVIEKAMSRLKKDYSFEYQIFTNISSMSKVEKNGVFKMIIAQAVKRDEVLSA